MIRERGIRTEIRQKNPYSEEYKVYMQSQEWQEKRKQRLWIDNFKCVMCGNEHARLQVHHIHYRTLGNENPMTDLATVCPACHEKLHNFYNRMR